MFYFYMYQITNLVNGKIYVGVHKTRNIDDGYMGSGKVIKHAIQKYGAENFTVVILEYFDTMEAMYAREKEVVNEEFLLREDVYNLRRGGTGGFDYINKNGLGLNLTVEGRRKGALVQVKTFQTPERIAKRVKTRKERSGFATFTGRKHSVESKDKISKSMLNKQDGSKNSQFGSCWIWHELIGNKKISFDCLPEFIEQGWQKGRKYRSIVL